MFNLDIYFPLLVIIQHLHILYYMHYFIQYNKCAILKGGTYLFGYTIIILIINHTWIHQKFNFYLQYKSKNL